MGQPPVANPPNAYSQYPPPPQGPPGSGYGQPPNNATNYSRPPPQGPPMGAPFNSGGPPGGAPYGSMYTANQANQDAQALRTAMKGFGTDEKAIINIVSQRTPEQIATLSHAYKANYGKSLADAFRSETSGDFGYLLQGFAMPQPEFECKCIHNSIAGLGTDEDALIELVVGRSNSEMNNLKQCYRYMYNRDMEREIASDTSHNFKRLLVSLLQAGRDETQQVYDTSADVEALYRAGEKRFGTDEGAFISIICTRSDAHLVQVFSQYQIKYGKPIQKVIKSEFSGDIERGLLSVVGYVQNRYEWAADQFEESMRGFGTREDKLSRLTIRFRHPHLMPHVKQAYQRKYGKSLYQRVHGETSGDYRRLLLASIGQ
ncbi:Annexin [Basidiobolus meristosporus CBS 931.73]|uniref:Annexin n=1 Tax=Basidiobolus meristosporus CBS 931.73 TaxID=1314790 RepID=A0A1Y1Y0Z0_9FUNG|nr:Annexin [Basidiobolus meristosporus CBS 931.73]|eukprot:ORX91638.1 Annexin [Basidiobolus meristosporus CBS 931.73]